jgi:HPt (histidine-containing phosphotransfer) domain-containing protein
MADVVLINVEEGSKRVMNNAKLYAKLLTKFKDDPNMKNIEDAFEAGDMEKAHVAAHTLKGVASNLSLVELAAKTLELETEIKNKSVNPDMLAVLKSTHELTLTEIDKVIAQYA